MTARSQLFFCVSLIKSRITGISDALKRWVKHGSINDEVVQDDGEEKTVTSQKTGEYPVVVLSQTQQSRMHQVVAEKLDHHSIIFR